MNYFELFSKSKHFNTFQYQVSGSNPVAVQSVEKYRQVLINHGAAPQYASKAVNKVMVNAINAQDHIRYAIDYYEMICGLLVFAILLIALFPYINRTMLTLSKHQPSPF